MPQPTIGRIRACVFDAYGTLFDVDAAARAQREALGADWERLARRWREKQLQYTWLRSLMGRYVDFRQVTAEALDQALDRGAPDDPGLARRLMALYDRLEAYPEVEDTLARLRAAGLGSAILSNGSPEMLEAAVSHARIGRLLDAVLSADSVGVYKPDPRVYRLAGERLGLAPERMCFVSANAWDAYAAKAFGFRVAWCNRFGQPPERIPAAPDAEITTLAELPGLLGV